MEIIKKNSKYWDGFLMEEVGKAVGKLRGLRFTGDGFSYDRPNFLFEIDQHMLDTKNPYRWKGLLTEGAGLLIDGKPKCMKSTIAGMMVAAALNLEGGIFGNIKCSMDPNKHILWLDTEQTPSQFNRMQSNMMRWAKLEKPPYIYHAYPLSQFGDPVEKLFMILKALEDVIKGKWRDTDGNLHNNEIGLIVIDVISDLVADENDRVQVNQLFDLLGQLQSETGTMIIFTLHQNKGDDKPVGVLGGKLEKKASSRIMCNRKGEDDAGPVYIRHKFNREAGELFNSFWLNYDEFGFPGVVDTDLSQRF